MFFQTGLTVFSAIFQLAFISLIAAFLIKRKMVSKEQIHALSNVTVNIFLPCLIISKFLVQFHPGELTNWWILPLSGAFLVFLGLFSSGIFFLFKKEKRPFMALSSFQNGIYITLPIGQILLPDQFDLYALYCFLLVIGLNVLMWSIGKVMVSGGMKGEIRLKDFLTPPLLSIVISVFLVFSRLSVFVPDQVVSAMDLLGSATIPLAVFVLGATMGSISLKKLPGIYDVLVVSIVKFGIIPAIVFAVMYFGGFYVSMPLICMVVLIQATSPAATNMILIVENYGGDSQAVSSMMLIQYLLCIVIMPVWIAFWKYAVG